MNALKKWMIIHFTKYQITTLPKWMFSQKLFLLFCLYPYSMFSCVLVSIGWLGSLVTISFYAKKKKLPAGIAHVGIILLI